MKIHRKESDGGPERKLLTGMIVSDEFMAGAVHFTDPTLIEADFVRQIAEWCLAYHKRYKKAPGRHIKDIFDAHAPQLDEDKRGLIADLLSSLSEEYERGDKLNAPYLLDQAVTYFKGRALTRLDQTVKGHLLNGDVAEAEAAVASFRRVGRAETSGGNPFTNMELLQRAFERAEKPLFTFPGALGRMLNYQLNRDQFIGIMAPEKRGKTWWLNELAIRAAVARNNVALFQVGDMSEEQVDLRLAERLSKRSSMAYEDGEFLMPVPDCRCNQTGGLCPKGRKCPTLVAKWSMEALLEAFHAEGGEEGHRPCSRCAGERGWRGSAWWARTEMQGDPLTWRQAWRVFNKFMGRTKGRDFRLSVHPSDQLSVSGIKGILDSWEAFDNFIPDVIIIDYADNLAPEPDDKRADFRHQENRKWKLLRGLSQERHCLVVTATQAAGRGYQKSSLDMSDYSEDKRKYAHVTGMYALNQTEEEKEAGIMRFGVLVQRAGEFFTKREVYVGQALRLGQPLVFSF